jgi:hypothetical protein
MKTKSTKHVLCRPPKDAFDVERLASNGKWIKDDGKPGLAFSGRQGFPSAPMAWSVKCTCTMLDEKCPHNKAMQRTSHKWNCANGRYVPAVSK